MKKVKHPIRWFFIILILAASAFFLNSKYKIISVAGKKFIAETAVTSEQQRKGLGDRTNLCSNCAMLFIFPREGRYSFWMKDMNFDLDILWISRGRIVYIAQNISYNTKDIFNPVVEADKVLEINAGLSKQYNFKIGDAVKVY